MGFCIVVLWGPIYSVNYLKIKNIYLSLQGSGTFNLLILVCTPLEIMYLSGQICYKSILLLSSPVFITVVTDQYLANKKVVNQNISYNILFTNARLE